jgi:L-fuculose-phosphate aldolase
MWRAVELEALARVYYLASLAGEPVVLPEEEIAGEIERFSAYGLRSPNG